MPRYYNKWICFQYKFDFNFVSKRLHYKTISKQLYPSNENLKLDILKCMAISSIPGLTWAEKKNSFMIGYCNQLHLNPEAAHTYFMWMCRTGLKEVKINTFKCVNFLSFGSLKSSSRASI